MKTSSTSSADFFTLKTLLFLAGIVLALFILVGCNEPTESRGFTGISGDRIGDDYVYYPRYEVYYVPARREYVYYDASTKAWIRTTTPTQVWAKDITGAAYVKMDFHDAPEGHHQDVVRRYPETWVPPEAVHGVPARTTNDDVREGKK
jgi:hypothetical protein